MDADAPDSRTPVEPEASGPLEAYDYLFGMADFFRPAARAGKRAARYVSPSDQPESEELPERLRA